MKDCSIDWSKFSFPVTQQSSSVAAATTTASSSSWNFLKTSLGGINNGISGSSAATTLKKGSTSHGEQIYSNLYERIGSLSDGILAEGRIVASVTQQLEDKLTSFVTETLQVTTMGVFLGAVVGAAIATGVIVGMLSVAVVLAGGTTAGGTTGGGSGREVQNPSKYSALPRQLYKCLPRFLVGQQRSPSNGFTGIVDSKKLPNTSTNTQQPGQAETAAAAAAAAAAEISSSVATGPLVILQAHPRTTNTDSTAQCLSCLKQLEADLIHHGLAWEDIRRLTVYLVSGRCDASIFRNILNEMHLQHKPLISILFVQQLEDEHIVLQLEAMACKNR